jgi:uncharacterized membrane protein
LTSKYEDFYAIFYKSNRYIVMKDKDGMKDLKQAGGCLVFILLIVVFAIVEAGGNVFLGVIAVIALSILGAFLTGCFDD